jgi:hypothetical protein
LATYFSKATFSNKNTGELIFASNGWRLINNDGVILTHKLYFDNMPHPGGTPDTTDVINRGSPLFLPHPGDSTKAYLLYGQLFTPFVIGGYNLRADKFFTYALLDIPSKTLIRVKLVTPISSGTRPLHPQRVLRLKGHKIILECAGQSS